MIAHKTSLIEFPAGSVEEYELIKDAATRELFEETGVEIEEKAD